MNLINKSDIKLITKLIKCGKILAIPTDTIYGFSCLATDNKAVDKLCKLKNRDDSKQFILLVSRNFDLTQLISVSDSILNFIYNHTPNPVTMIVNRNPNFKLADNFTLPTVAIRIPDDDFLQDILQDVGLIISTSCNIQGEPAINDYNQILQEFPTIDAVVKCDSIKSSQPSTIIDLTDGMIKILRQGSYKIK